MDINIGDIIIVEDIEGKKYQDTIIKVSKYSIENTSLYMIDCNSFYLEFMNDFKKINVDIISDSSVDILHSISKYKLREVWNVNPENNSMVKIYSNYN